MMCGFAAQLTDLVQTVSACWQWRLGHSAMFEIAMFEIAAD
jgi:hypothetical protein